jgi:hypothetical protein
MVTSPCVRTERADPSQRREFRCTWGPPACHRSGPTYFCVAQTALSRSISRASAMSFCVRPPESCVLSAMVTLV